MLYRKVIILYIWYGVNGKNSDMWVTERIYMDIMYTATQNSDEDVEEFYWDCSTEIADNHKDCILLEDASDTYVDP